MSDREPRVILHQKFGRIHFIHVMPMSDGIIIFLLTWFFIMMINLAILALNLIIFLVVTAFTGTKGARITSISALVLISLFVGLILTHPPRTSNTTDQLTPDTQSAAAVGQTATPMPPPTLQTSALLYKADWSSGLNGWNGALDWKTENGMLVDDGSGPHFWKLSITAPYNPSVSDYAIVAEIQVVSQSGCNSFGLVARAINGEGEQAGVNFCECHCAGLWDRNDVPQLDFDPGTSWHKYRLDVMGTEVKFTIDDTTVVFDAQDTRFSDPGNVGLWCDTMSIQVRNFEVYSL